MHGGLRLTLWLAGGGLITGVAAIVAAVLTAPDPRELLAYPCRPCIEVVDRHRAPLRLLPADDGQRFRPTDGENVSPHLVHAVLAAEDRRFFYHPGIDPASIVRAAWQAVRAGRIVSGGSTLTMQLARILDPRPRSLRAKLAQAALALRLEVALSKHEILSQYLSRAPLANRVVGFEAAARVYLGKPAAQLSPAEAALLAVVPRQPSHANPWRREALLRARRDGLLYRMHHLGYVDDATLAAGLAERVVLAEDPFRYPAPHFVNRLVAEVGDLPSGAARIVGTLDLALQQRVALIIREHLAELVPQRVTHMAVTVLDVQRGEWLAIEGSGGFWDHPGGEQDGTRTPRQPGSALKPFTYAAAFDRGFTPATVLPDIPRAFVWKGGTWSPRNYDEHFHGPLRARVALACSVNVPAVFLLNAVGPTVLLDELRAAGISTLDKGADYYGLGLTLGAAEVRLDELTLAYAALLRGGEWRGAASWRAVLDADDNVLRRPQLPTPRRVCSPQAAAQVVDVLADPEARAPAFGAWSVLRLPFPAAVKTGTSEGFRDNWCIGGTREVAVGVWAGNFDRAPMGNVSGVSGAGAVWREVMLEWAALAHPGADPGAIDTLTAAPAGIVQTRVCALSGLAPSPACPATVRELLSPDALPLAACDWHRPAPDGQTAIAWPPLFREWAAGEARLTERPADTKDVAAGAGRSLLDPTRGAAVAVVSPTDEDAFVVSPDLPQRFQTLELRCAVRGDPATVTWVVDGRDFAIAGSPYSARWRLEPGTHRFEVAAGALRSRPVTIEIYGR